MNSNLFSTLRIKDMVLNNRIVMSPMQQYSSVNGLANDWHLVHLGSRAVGGAGLIITESAVVNEVGRSTVNDLGIWSDDHIAPLKKITRFIRENHSASAIQLAHFGSKGSKSHPNDGLQPISPAEGGWQTVSSSAKAPFAGMAVPKALTLPEIAAIQQDFVSAAIRAVSAGFDAIEIHAAHGYLFHQFYSELINERTDQYGGSFENRIRLLVETIRAVREVIPERMPLLVRISAVDYVDDPKAWTLEDSIKLIKILENEGVDLLTASAGGFVWVDKSNIQEGYQVPFAEALRNNTTMLIGAIGGIKTAPFAAEVISSGKADVVVIAREHLRNPYFSLNAATQLGFTSSIPFQYKRGF